MANILPSVTSGATSLAAITTNVAKNLSNLILATPASTQGYQPTNKTGVTSSPPPALLFHYEGEQTVSFESDITDHFIEDNTSIQDQVALRPVIVTTHGYIGELNDVAPFALQPLANIVSSLASIGSYVPALTLTALIAYNEAFFAYQTAQSLVNAGTAAWSGLSGTAGESVINGQQLTKSPNQNKQQTMFQQLWGYWNNRTFFTVQTPWAVFQSMIIYKLRAIQSEETNVITDFEISFKQIRTANSATVVPSATGQLASQNSALVQNGTQSAVPSLDLLTGVQQNNLSPTSSAVVSQ